MGQQSDAKDVLALRLTSCCWREVDEAIADEITVISASMSSLICCDARCTDFSCTKASWELLSRTFPTNTPNSCCKFSA